MLLKCIGWASLALAALVGLAFDLSLWWLPVSFVAAYALLFLLAFLFLWIVCSTVDQDKPQEHDSKFFRGMMNLYIETLISLVMVRVHAEGTEKVPKEGRFLLVCNHLFLADPGVLLNVLPDKQLAFITKQENRSMFLIGNIMHKILCQPLDRDNDRAALKTILKCIQLLKEDEVSIGVFPEGYTSKDGLLHPFRSGVFKIAQKTQVPIVVCTIQNTRDIFPNLKHLRHTDVPVHVVEVIPPEELTGQTTTQIAQRVYETMIADLGEEFRFTEEE